MQPLFDSITLAFRSLTRGSMIKIFLTSLLLNTLVLVSLAIGIFWALDSVTLFGWWDHIADYGLKALAVILAYFSFPLLLPIMVSFFDTAIAGRIEARDYPDVPVPQPPFWPTLRQDMAFSLKVLAFNLLALPFYLIPLLNIPLYYALNGYLLGREFFRVVAGRHVTPAVGKQIWRKNWVILFGCGICITLCATIPFLNLIAPIWGVAVMVHLFHRLKPDYKRLAIEDKR